MHRWYRSILSHRNIFSSSGGMKEMNMIPRSISLFNFEQVAGFKWKPPQTNKKGPNVHRSNKAKEGKLQFYLFLLCFILLYYWLIGLYHGKDVRFGHSIAHSFAKSLRRWNPNVQKKRLWSDALGQWIRFNTTVAGMKAIDDIGGVDQYLINLDEKLVEPSNFIKKYRNLIVRALYLKGELSPKHIKYFGLDKNPITAEELSSESNTGIVNDAHSRKASK